MPQTPARTGVSLDDRQDLARHLDDDRVGVAVRHQAGEAAAARHPVAARVVDDDQVDPAGLGALGREARAGAPADDRPAVGDLRAEPLERFQAVHDQHPTSCGEPSRGSGATCRGIPLAPARAASYPEPCTLPAVGEAAAPTKGAAMRGAAGGARGASAAARHLPPRAVERDRRACPGGLERDGQTARAVAPCRRARRGPSARSSRSQCSERDRGVGLSSGPVGPPGPDEARPHIRSPRLRRGLRDHLVQAVRHRAARTPDRSRPVSSPCASTAGSRCSRRAPKSASSAAASWKGWPSTAIIETRAAGRRAPSGPLRRVQLARDAPAELGALLGRGAHQRHGRVVDVEIAAGELLREPVSRAEVDHVERAQRDDLRDPELACGLEPVGPRREHAADEIVRELRRRHVERRRRRSRRA